MNMDMLRSIGKQSVRGLASLDNCLVYQKYVLVTCSTVVIRRTLLISCGGADFSSVMALKDCCNLFNVYCTVPKSEIA